MRKKNIYTYTDRQGREVDLTSWIDERPLKKGELGMSKEHVAHLARSKDRIHGMARAIDALRNAGYTRSQVMEVVDWILSGRSLTGIS